MNAPAGPRWEAGLAELQPFGQGVWVFGQAGEAGTGQDGQTPCPNGWSIDGVGSVKATVGLKRPFFSFRVVNNTASSPSIGVKLDHQTLVLVNECTGWTEVGSLFLKADRRKGGAGRLLSQSRYMLIGAQPELFAENVLAELRGVFAGPGRG